MRSRQNHRKSSVIPVVVVVAGTHLELLVEFAAVSIQHGQIERAKVCVEAGTSARFVNLRDFWVVTPYSRTYFS